MGVAELIIMGVGIIANIVKAIPLLKSGTAAEKGAALTEVATGVAGGVGMLSKGGQANTAAQVVAAIPKFQGVVTGLMELFETSGLPGAEKQALVTKIANDTLTAYQNTVTGGQKDDAIEFDPAIRLLIDATVPVLFPKDNTAIENLKPAE